MMIVFLGNLCYIMWDLNYVWIPRGDYLLGDISINWHVIGSVNENTFIFKKKEKEFKMFVN